MAPIRPIWGRLAKLYGGYILVRHYYNETDNTHTNISDFNLWVSTEAKKYEQLYGRD